MNAENQRAGTIWGSLIADALAMPVHWYYDLSALLRDYGVVSDYMAPRSPHADSILWRSTYHPLNEHGEILHEQAAYWGQRDVHYHQFLQAGENTLNLQLSRLLMASLVSEGGYDPDDYLERYIDFMLTPGSHRDTYVEECHRQFFTHYAQGKAPSRCGGPDIHIGGLAHVGVLCAYFGTDEEAARAAVRTHVQLTHESPEVLEAAGALTRILCGIFAGGDLRDLIEQHGSGWFSRRQAESWLSLPDATVVGERLSSACYIGEAFPASLYLAWKYHGDFAAGVLANTNLGGDNCHRGAVVGALLGGALGAEAIPTHWRERLVHGAEVSHLIDHLLAAPAGADEF